MTITLVEYSVKSAMSRSLAELNLSEIQPRSVHMLSRRVDGKWGSVGGPIPPKSATLENKNRKRALPQVSHFRLRKVIKIKITMGWLYHKGIRGDMTHEKLEVWEQHGREKFLLPPNRIGLEGTSCKSNFSAFHRIQNHWDDMVNRANGEVCEKNEVWTRSERH